MQFFACLLLAQCKNTSEEHARQEQTHAGALKRKKGETKRVETNKHLVLK